MISEPARKFINYFIRKLLFSFSIFALSECTFRYEFELFMRKSDHRTSVCVCVCMRGGGGGGTNFAASGRDLLSEGIPFLLKGAFLGGGGGVASSCFLVIPLPRDNV